MRKTKPQETTLSHIRHYQAGSPRLTGIPTINNLYLLILTQLQTSSLSLSRVRTVVLLWAGEISDIHYMFTEPTPTPSFKPHCHVMPSTPSSLCLYPSLPSSLQTAHGRLHLHSHPSASPSIPKQPRRAALSIQPSHSPHRQTKVPSQRLALQTALTTQRLFGFIVRS